MLRSSATSHAVPPTEVLPHATITNLPCRGFGVLNWVIGVLILVLFRNFARDLSPSKPSNWTQHKDTNLTHSGFVLLSFLFFPVWLLGKFAKSFCVLKFHVLIGYL